MYKVLLITCDNYVNVATMLSLHVCRLSNTYCLFTIGQHFFTILENRCIYQYNSLKLVPYCLIFQRFHVPDMEIMCVVK